MAADAPDTPAEGEPAAPRPTRRKARRSLTEWIGFAPPPEPRDRPVVSTQEVFALLEHAANKGIQRDKISALSGEIHKPTPDPSTVAGLYADLVAETKPVTGRSLIHSRDEGFHRLAGIASVTTIFFVLAVGNFIVDNWVADIVEPEDGRFWLDVKRYVWDYLTPFFWGGLGA